MDLSRDGEKEILSHEAICQRVYYDSVRVKTIGIGFTKSEIPDIDKMSLTDYMPIPEIMDRYRHGLRKYINAVNKALKVPIEQHQFDALVSICYNIGIGGMTNSTFMRRINAKDSLKNIRAGIMMWLKPPELKRRRTQEADLYTTGKYSNNGYCTLAVTDGKGHISYRRGKNIKMDDII